MDSLSTAPPSRLNGASPAHDCSTSNGAATGLSAASRPAVVDQIGDTPLLRLDGIGADLPDTVTLYAKAEHLNPGGSVKDRPARRMIEDGLRSGAFQPNQTLIDATSGNTGIAYAMIGAAMGLDVLLALPENASDERKKTLRAYGAKLLLTDAMDGTDGAQRRVKEIVAEDPDRYFYPDQYNNDANWQAHYDETGAEIWSQTDGRVTHFVAGLGTTGTFTGVTRRLKTEHPGVTAVAFQPKTSLHGMANVATALEVAQSLDAGVVVTLLCDTGTRYLSDDWWEG